MASGIAIHEILVEDGFAALRIGVARKMFRLTPRADRVMEEALDVMKRAGASSSIRPISSRRGSLAIRKYQLMLYGKGRPEFYISHRWDNRACEKPERRDRSSMRKMRQGTQVGSARKPTDQSPGERSPQRQSLHRCPLKNAEAFGVPRESTR